MKEINIGTRYKIPKCCLTCKKLEVYNYEYGPWFQYCLNGLHFPTIEMTCKRYSKNNKIPANYKPSSNIVGDI